MKIKKKETKKKRMTKQVEGNHHSESFLILLVKERNQLKVWLHMKKDHQEKQAERKHLIAENTVLHTIRKSFTILKNIHI